MARKKDEQPSVNQADYETLAAFVVLQALTMCAFAFTSSNLSTLAMEHMAAIAGTASSVQGVMGTIGGAIIGFAIGQEFDGTPRPFLIGSAGCAAAAFAIMLATEPKRLFARLKSEPAGVAMPSVPEEVA